MLLRRAFYWWQFPAAVVLPAWLLIGWTIFGGIGWELLGVVLGSVLLTLSMLAICGIIFARKDVRTQRALSWVDVALLAAWQGTVIALGFFSEATTGLVVAIILITLLAFWSAIVQLVVEARRRVRTAFASFEVPTPTPGQRTASLSPRDDGEYIVIDGPVSPRI